MGAAKREDQTMLQQEISEAVEQKQLDDFQSRLEARVSGKHDRLESTILGYVAKDKFDFAVKELRYYQEMMKDLIPFVDRTQRVFDHCEELILAIKAKKSFPAMESLPMGKRQEMLERVQDHFDELQKLLKRVEQVENDIRVQDTRSTVWVVQAFVLCSMIIVIFAVVLEAFRTMGMPITVLYDDIQDVIFKLLGL
jgi:hypothetical protein